MKQKTEEIVPRPLVAAFRLAEGHESDAEMLSALEEWKEKCSVLRCTGMNRGILVRFVYTSLVRKLEKITKKNYPLASSLEELVQQFDSGITEMRAVGVDLRRLVAEYGHDPEGPFKHLPKLAYKSKYWNDFATRSDISTSAAVFLRDKIFGTHGEPAEKVAEKILVEEGWRLVETDKKYPDGTLMRDPPKENRDVFAKHPKLQALLDRPGRDAAQRLKRELTFLFNMFDDRSPFARLSPDKRLERSLEESEISEKERSDQLFVEACAYYEEMRKTEKKPFAIAMGEKKKFSLWVRNSSVDDDSSGTSKIDKVTGLPESDVKELEDDEDGTPDETSDVDSSDRNETEQQVETDGELDKSDAAGGSRVSREDDSNPEPDTDDGHDPDNIYDGTTDPLDQFLNPPERSKEDEACFKAFLMGLNYRDAIIWLASIGGVNITDETLCRFCGCGKTRTAELKKKLFNSILSNRRLSTILLARDPQFFSELRNHCRLLIQKRPDGPECLAWLDRILGAVESEVVQKEEERQNDYEEKPRDAYWSHLQWNSRTPPPYA